MAGEVVAPVAPAVTKSTAPVAPKAAPGAQAAPAAPPAADPAEVTAAREALKAAEAKYSAKTREQITERRKWEKEKLGFGDKLKAADEYARLQKNAKLNPLATAQALWGEKYWDALTEAKINGGAPTADTVALSLEQMEEKIEAKYAAKDAERAKAAEVAQTQQVEQARRQLVAEAADFWKTGEKDYPVFKKLGDASAIANTLSQRIEAEYHRTTQRDESGTVLRDGRVLTVKEAADGLEQEILALVEEAASHEKYQPKLREKLQPAKASGSVVRPSQQPSSPQQQAQPEQQPRKTLSNDLTGSTQTRSPPMTREERLARAAAAYNAIHQR